MNNFEKGLDPKEAMRIGLKQTPYVRIKEENGIIYIHCPDNVFFHSDVISKLLNANIDIIAYSSICQEYEPR